MNVTLKELLNLVGKLDDQPGEENPRERFRNFIKSNITEVGQLRDYILECLRYTDEQFNKALQDLVNYIGAFLGFNVTYGRYRGITGEIGFDGLWKSPKNYNIVVEVKKTGAYAIKTNILTRYVDELISERIIDNWDNALGLYVIGNLSEEVKQLENSIIMENRINQLRIISVDSLLNLAEIKNEYDISHKDILLMLKPMSPRVDAIVNIMQSIVASKAEKGVKEEEFIEREIEINKSEEAAYWLTPVKDDDEQTALECVKNLVGDEKIYAFSSTTPNRRKIKPGDKICFYATTIGVIADAEIITKPDNNLKSNKLRNPEKYPWIFKLNKTRLYLDNPLVIDMNLRSKLEAFKDKNLDANWSWFVQATRKITKNDFKILTGK